MIGIGGLARSGKDTLASNLALVIKEDWGIDVKIFSFAKSLKFKLDTFLKEEFDISSFSEDSEEKKITRPILVAYGEAMKIRYGQDVWTSMLMTQIKDETSKNKVFPIISDVRFDFEAKIIQDHNGQVIHISKDGNEPPNSIEAFNDPLVYSLADINHTWPPYPPDSIHECNSHANILWQMMKETHQEKWKKIYI